MSGDFPPLPEFPMPPDQMKVITKALEAAEAHAYEVGRKAGLEEAVKIAEGLVYDLGGDVPFGEFEEAIARLTQGTDKGLERK
jgi:hypothetical protein